MLLLFLLKRVWLLYSAFLCLYHPCPSPGEDNTEHVLPKLQQPWFPIIFPNSSAIKTKYNQIPENGKSENTALLEDLDFCFTASLQLLPCILICAVLGHFLCFVRSFLAENALYQPGTTILSKTIDISKYWYSDLCNVLWFSSQNWANHLSLISSSLELQ